MIRRAGALLVLFAGTATAAASPPAARLITGCVDLTGFKDPAAIVLPPGWIDADTSTTLLLLGDYGARRLRGFTLDVATATIPREVPIELSAAPPGHMRWAPMATLDGDDALWLASTMGRVDRGGIDWPSFRIMLARAHRDPATMGRLVFADERVLDLAAPPELIDLAAKGGLAYIDPELVANPAGGWWVYYTIVSHGIAGVRHHEEWIRRREFGSDFGMLESRNDTLIVSGDVTQPHEGVVEAPALSPTLIRQSLMVMSSGPSDNGQRIGIVSTAASPQGRPSGDGRWLLSTRPDDKPWRLAGEEWERDGVGGQAVIEIDGVAWLIYQGLGTKHGEAGSRAFRAALLDITTALQPAPSESQHEGPPPPAP